MDYSTLKFYIFISLCATVAAYYIIDEDIDITEITSNRILLKRFAACFLDRGPCTKSMLIYKSHLKDAVDIEYAACSPSQKHYMHEFINAMVQKFPNDLEQIRNKYDSTGAHVAKILTEIEKY